MERNEDDDEERIKREGGEQNQDCPGDRVESLVVRNRVYGENTVADCQTHGELFLGVG